MDGTVDPRPVNPNFLIELQFYSYCLSENLKNIAVTYNLIFKMNMNNQVKQYIGDLIVLKFCKYLTSNNKESDINWRIIITYYLRMYINNQYQ